MRVRIQTDKEIPVNDCRYLFCVIGNCDSVVKHSKEFLKKILLVDGKLRINVKSGHICDRFSLRGV